MIWEYSVGFAALVAIAAAIFIATRPSVVELWESSTLNTDASRLVDLVTDLRRWNPWAEWDPAAACRYLGPTHGAGAQLEWESKGQAGSGSMVITSVRAGDKEVAVLLEETSPTPRLHLTHLRFTTQGAATTVTWSYKQHLNFFGKAARFFGLEDGLKVKLKQGIHALHTRSLAEANDVTPRRLMDCSFCGKNQREVKKLIAGPNVCICDECIMLSNDIIHAEIDQQQSA